MPYIIEKILSANDVGETGAHQAGPYVGTPRTVPEFFPNLDESQENPHVTLTFVDRDGRRYDFEFRYYNEKKEYHLSHMTGFFKDHHVNTDDVLVLTREDDGTLRVEIRRPGDPVPGEIVDSSGQWFVRSLPETDPEEEYLSGLPEGAKTRIETNRYERSEENRRRCLEHHGTDCLVCGVSFGKEYGEIGDGFIHVHHVTPVADLGESYVVDPKRDLVPVCPNCHAMLHRQNPPYSLEDLKALRAAAE